MSRILLKIELLGRLYAVPADQPPVDYAPQPTGTLLAFLALFRDRPAPREEIIALIWPDVDEETGRHRLRQSLYALRRQLEPAGQQESPLLLTTRTTLQLNPAEVVTDVTQFEEAVRLASPGKDASIREKYLTEAIRLYRGDLLPGFFQDCFLVERNRLEGIYRQVLRELTLLYEQTGEYQRGIEVAHRALALDPLLEETHIDLIRLYAATGQSANALRQYQEMERTLERELGVQPSENARALIESLRQNGSSHVSVSPSVSNGLSKPDIAFTEEVAAGVLPTVPMRRSSPSAGRLALALGLLVISLFAWKGRNNLPASSSPALITDTKAQVAENPVPMQPPLHQPLWVRRYQKRSGDQDSEPIAMTTDAMGTIYITGFLRTEKTDVDFLTLKYDTNGNLLWEQRYDGPGHDVDRARSLVVDATGDVYVAGDSDNGKGNGTTRLCGLDIAIIKYDGKTGKPSPAWPDVGFGKGVRRYNGEDDGEDRAVQMLLAPQGGVYVLGASWSHKGSPRNGGSDYTLIKYGANGERDWVARYHEGPHLADVPVAMVCDSEGNVYVTGSSKVVMPVGQEQNFLTIKYAPNGRRLWVQHYGANNHFDDQACAIGLDRGGNVYVIGEGLGPVGTPDAARSGCLTLKYSPNGELLWMRGTVMEGDRIIKVGAAGVSADGATTVTGQAQNELGQFVFRTVVRNANGLLDWTATERSVRTGTAMGEDMPVGLILYHSVTITGNLFTGEPNPSLLQRAERDLFTLHYDDAGHLAWVGQYDANKSADYARVITLDPEHNTVVAGQSDDGQGKGIVVFKYRD